MLRCSAISWTRGRIGIGLRNQAAQLLNQQIYRPDWESHISQATGLPRRQKYKISKIGFFNRTWPATLMAFVVEGRSAAWTEP
jgi:hypothetical protein